MTFSFREKKGLLIWVIWRDTLNLWKIWIMGYFQRQEMHQEAIVLSREDKWMGMCVHGFSDGLGVKNPHVKAGDTRDMGSVLDGEDPLEKGTGTHSSILAYKIPWSEEPSGLQSMGPPKVRYDWACSYIHIYVHINNAILSGTLEKWN